LAALYKKANQLDEAGKEYREVLRLKKDDMEARGALTSIYVKKQNYPELVALLKENVVMAPQDSNQHYRLGLVYEFQKDYDNAAASYAEAISSKEDNAKALSAMGRIKMKTGNIQEAKEYLERAKAADPTMEEAALLLSNIREELAPNPLSKFKKSKKATKGKKGKKSKPVRKSSASKSKKPAKKAVSKPGK